MTLQTRSLNGTVVKQGAACLCRQRLDPIPVEYRLFNVGIFPTDAGGKAVGRARYPPVVADWNVVAGLFFPGSGLCPPGLDRSGPVSV